jgi:hypothetical protein
MSRSSASVRVADGFGGMTVGRWPPEKVTKELVGGASAIVEAEKYGLAFALGVIPFESSAAGGKNGLRSWKEPAGAKEVAEKSKMLAPRGLKSARRVNNKRLRRWPEGQLYPKSHFSAACKARRISNILRHD